MNDARAARDERPGQRAVSVELAPAEFDVCGPLPSGVTVLEASAGTGKTYTIAALTARHVADGLATRAAAAGHVHADCHRRASRARTRAAGQRRAGADAGAGRRVLAEEDRLVALLAQGTVDDVQRRRDHLARAVASFDAATIATTHGFCQEMLGGLGIAGDLEPDVTFVEDLSDLASRGGRRPLRASLQPRRRPGFRPRRRRSGSRGPRSATRERRSSRATPTTRRCADGSRTRPAAELEARKRADGGDDL